ncbi:MAG: acetyltransferase, family [Phycisphaerales bacterium]|nr:acetyltransferase, family [Phycisphaerales bacterium]
MTVDVRVVPVDVLWDLRHRILRKNLPPEAARFAGDDRDDSVHVGAFFGQRLVGGATLHLEALEGDPAWRLRGMAVDADTQGLSIGRKLLLVIDQHVLATPPHRLWCNARLPAVGFYERCGWEAVSGVYDIPTAGPHRTMIRRFENSQASSNLAPR